MRLFSCYKFLTVLGRGGKEAVSKEAQWFLQLLMLVIIF